MCDIEETHEKILCDHIRHMHTRGSICRSMSVSQDVKAVGDGDRESILSAAGVDD